MMKLDPMKILIYLESCIKQLQNTFFSKDTWKFTKSESVEGHK